MNLLEPSARSFYDYLVAFVRWGEEVSIWNPTEHCCGKALLVGPAVRVLDPSCPWAPFNGQLKSFVRDTSLSLGLNIPVL